MDDAASGEAGSAAGREQELGALKGQANHLSATLEDIRNRIDQLERDKT